MLYWNCLLLYWYSLTSNSSVKQFCNNNCIIDRLIIHNFIQNNRSYCFWRFLIIFKFHNSRLYVKIWYHILHFINSYNCSCYTSIQFDCKHVSSDDWFCFNIVHYFNYWYGDFTNICVIYQCFVCTVSDRYVAYKWIWLLG